MPSLLNFATHAGHVPIRTAVLGPEAVHERVATPDEIAQMAALLRRALELGALGFTTDQVVGNIGPRNTRLPGQVCAEDELLAFARVLGEAPGPGWFAMAPRRAAARPRPRARPICGGTSGWPRRAASRS